MSRRGRAGVRVARLSPGGALAPAEAGWRAALREALGDDAWAAARELAGCAPPARRDVVLALAAACLEAAARGSTRVPLAALATLLGELTVPTAIVDAAVALAAAPAGARGDATELLGAPGEFRPLLVDDAALTTQRLRAHEQLVGGRLRARLAEPPLPFDAAAVAAALADVDARTPVLGGRAIVLSGEQRRAVVVAAHQPMTVISGGPGTGKTSIVVSVLRLLLRLGVAPDAVALAAPTGKAAKRMEEAIDGYLADIAARAPEDDLLRARRPEPTTLHRLLGYSPRRDKFLRHAGDPLPHAVVIVDEASMIDLALMQQLVAATRPDARLVLLGDAEQLPSVDAGAVLRDLVPPVLRPPPRPWDALVPPPTAPPGTPDLRDGAAVRLTHSYRMNPADPDGSAILEASRAFNVGEVPPVVAARSPGPHLVGRAAAAAVEFRGVELLDAGDAERDALLARWFSERCWAVDGAPLDVTEPLPLDDRRFAPSEVTRLAALEARVKQARVLCLTRHAARAVNAVMQGHLRAALGDAAPGPSRLPPGTPVLMTRNDYQLGLFNGDQGLVLPVVTPDDDEPRLRLVFRVKDGFEAFEPAALGQQVEPCWAMTVHKAQGSEFRHVALVLPAPGAASDGPHGDDGDDDGDDVTRASALACREVVYTAVTRASRGVVVLGSAAALADAVARRLVRWSALGDPASWAP